MKKENLGRATKTGVSVFAFGILVSLFWLYLQNAVGELIPREVYNVTGFIAQTFIFLSISLLVWNILPPLNLVRMLFYLFGVIGFLVNLLSERNSGNVALEVALTTIMVVSLYQNWHKLMGVIKQPVSHILAKGIWISFCYFLGWLAAERLPLSVETQMQGWWWAVIAFAGGFALFFAVNLLENEVVGGQSVTYVAIYMVGNILLAVSYLGEYSRAGLILNVGLTAVLLSSLVWYKLLCPRKEPQNEPSTD